MTTAQRRIEVAKIKPGDHVTISGWPPAHFEVVDGSDPALLVIRAPTGRELKIGRQCVAAIVPAPREAQL